MSTLPPKADMCSAPARVRFVPKADIAGCSYSMNSFATGSGVAWPQRGTRQTKNAPSLCSPAQCLFASANLPDDLYSVRGTGHQ